MKRIPGFPFFVLFSSRKKKNYKTQNATKYTIHPNETGSDVLEVQKNSLREPAVGRRRGMAIIDINDMNFALFCAFFGSTDCRTRCFLMTIESGYRCAARNKHTANEQSRRFHITSIISFEWHNCSRMPEITSSWQRSWWRWWLRTNERAHTHTNASRVVII